MPIYLFVYSQTSHLSHALSQPYPYRGSPCACARARGHSLGRCQSSRQLHRRRRCLLPCWGVAQITGDVIEPQWCVSLAFKNTFHDVAPLGRDSRWLSYGMFDLVRHRRRVGNDEFGAEGARALALALAHTRLTALQLAGTHICLLPLTRSMHVDERLTCWRCLHRQLYRC